MTYGCEILFDAETAERVKREVRDRMGGECPCDRDEQCPLLPAGSSGLVVLPMPTVLAV
jgi:hypothetical protein